MSDMEGRRKNTSDKDGRRKNTSDLKRRRKDESRGRRKQGVSTAQTGIAERAPVSKTRRLRLEIVRKMNSEASPFPPQILLKTSRVRTLRLHHNLLKPSQNLHMHIQEGSPFPPHTFTKPSHAYSGRFTISSSHLHKTFTCTFRKIHSFFLKPSHAPIC
jgi:hypothetical protein